MECTDPHLNRRLGVHHRQPFAHLLCGLDREGERKNGRWRLLPLKKVTDAMDERARLARTGAGVDQQRSLIPSCGFQLAWVQKDKWGRF